MQSNKDHAVYSDLFSSKPKYKLLLLLLLLLVYFREHEDNELILS
jgi:hypothetical protein